MSREWYVFKIGKRDPNGGGRVFAQAQARPAQPRPARRGAVDALLDAVQEQDVAPVADQGYGFELGREDRNNNMVFTSEEAAERWAREQAALNPKVQFGIFSCGKVFETTAPVVIEKKFNDAGELLVAEKQQ